MPEVQPPTEAELAAEVAAMNVMHDASEAWRIHNTALAIEGAEADARAALLGGTATPWARRLRADAAQARWDGRRDPASKKARVKARRQQ